MMTRNEIDQEIDGWINSYKPKFQDLLNHYYLLEHNFRTIMPNSGLDKIIDLFNDLKDILSKISGYDILKIKEEETWHIEHRIAINDKEIVIKIGNFHGKSAHYNDEEQCIYLDFAFLFENNRKNEMLDIIIHEIGHSLSERVKPEILEKIKTVYSKDFYDTITKLEYKYKLNNISYDDMLSLKKTARCKEREEFDAINTVISTRLYMQYKIDPRIKEELIDWLRKKCNPDYMPKILNNWKEIIKIWYDKPTLFKDFADGLFTFVHKQLNTYTPKDIKPMNLP